MSRKSNFREELLLGEKIVHPREQPEQKQQAGPKSAACLMLLVFQTMIISVLSIECKADENDWFIYLGTREAKKAPRRNILYSLKSY